MDDWLPSGVERPGNSLIDLDGKYQSERSLLSDAVLATYQIAKDDRALRNSPHLFEPLRGDYPVRREFGFYSVTAANVETETLKKLKELGFNCYTERKREIEKFRRSVNPGKI